MVTDDKLLQTLTGWVHGRFTIDGNDLRPLDDQQAEFVATFLMPVINREEYLRLRKIAMAAIGGHGPCVREEDGAILTKLLDEIPVSQEGAV